MPTWTGAISTDWNNALNWVTPAAVPTAATDAIFSGTPVNNCVMGNSRSCRALTFTGYTGTLTVATFTLTTNNNITFQANQSSIIIGTTGTLASGATQTITSNTGVWPLNFQILNVGQSITITGDMRITGSLLSAGGSVNISGNKIFVGTNISWTTQLFGTTDIIMNGSGTYSGGATTQCNLEIDTTGSITITGSVRFTRRFIITAAGSITMTAADVTILNTTTVDLGGRSIGNLSHSTSGVSTYTYLTNVQCSSLTLSGSNTSTYTGPGKILASGSYTFNAGNANGTLVVELNGTGTMSTGTSLLPLIISTSGIITTSSFTLGNTLTYTAGAVNTGATTMTLNTGVTVNSAGINWYNVIVPTSVSVVLSSLLNITNNLTISGNFVSAFSGTAGWTCANLLCSSADRTIILQSGITYTTTTNVTMLGTNAQRITMRSNAPTVSYAIWTLQNPASQSIAYVNAQGIDSNAGMTIYSFGGTITTSLPALNWGLGASQGTKAFTFVS